MVNEANFAPQREGEASFFEVSIQNPFFGPSNQPGPSNVWSHIDFLPSYGFLTDQVMSEELADLLQLKHPRIIRDVFVKVSSFP